MVHYTSILLYLYTTIPEFTEGSDIKQAGLALHAFIRAGNRDADWARCDSALVDRVCMHGERRADHLRQGINLSQTCGPCSTSSSTTTVCTNSWTSLASSCYSMNQTSTKCIYVPIRCSHIPSATTEVQHIDNSMAALGSVKVTALQ